MANMQVSVIIPFFRGVETLARAVTSVRLQTYDNIEIIVVSDDSPDDLSGFVTEFPEVRIVNLPQNCGPGVARNYGISHARGDFVAFLDSDDWWYPNKLAVQVTLMAESNAMWGHHPYDIVTNDGNWLRRVSNEHLYGDVQQETMRSFRVQTSCIVVRRDALASKECRFSEERIGEDGSLYRALARRYPIHRTPYALSAFVSHGNNAGFSPSIQLWSRWRAANALTTTQRREMALLDRIAYRWVIVVAPALGIASAEQPPTHHRRLLIGAAYLPAWLIFRRPVRTGG